MRWRIYYGDWSTFSDRDGEPWEAPTFDVQVAVNEQLPPASPRLKPRRGTHCYYYRPDVGWMGCDEAGLFDYLFHYRGPKAVIFGRTIADAVFRAIEARAKTEGFG